jgi:hypothetical protein
VQQQVVFHEINVAEIKLKLSNHAVFEESFVHKLNHYFRVLSLLLLNVSWLQEEMLRPNHFSKATNIIFSCCVLFLSQASNLNQGINCRVCLYLDLFCFLNKNVNHVVSSLHLTDSWFNPSLT